MAKISVIIPVYNVGPYLSECLGGVCAQTFRDIEIICVNDGSTDNSGDVLAEWAARDKRIIVIDQKNSGVVAARNNGVARSHGELIFMLDGDDVISPDALAVMYDAFMAGRGDIITSRVMLFGAESGPMCLLKPTRANMAARNCLVNAALMRRADFDAAGGFDAAFATALEDYDLWLNLMYRHHKRVYRVPAVLFFYRIKNRDIARNYQHRDMHHELELQLQRKYPQMRWWRVLHRLRRFVFRIVDGRVRVFKIPVGRIKNDWGDYS